MKNNNLYKTLTNQKGCFSLFFLISLVIIFIIALVAFILTMIFTRTGLQGTEVQLQGNVLTIANNAPVIFDNILSDTSSNIAYDATTGKITVTGSGTYKIDWWFSADTSATLTTINLSIVTSTGKTITSSSLTLPGQISGNALLDIKASKSNPVTIQLVNTTGNVIPVAPTTVRAGLTIINTD